MLDLILMSLMTYENPLTSWEPESSQKSEKSRWIRLGKLTFERPITSQEFLDLKKILGKKIYFDVDSYNQRIIRIYTQ